MENTFELEYESFSVRLPKNLVQRLDAVALKRYQRPRMRTQLLIDLLTSHEEMSQAIQPENSTDKQAKRKRALV